MTGHAHPMSGFDEPVHRWQDIPGWFQWRSAQQEAVANFGDGSRFVEVGCYLGRSICSLARPSSTAAERSPVCCTAT